MNVLQKAAEEELFAQLRPALAAAGYAFFAPQVQFRLDGPSGFLAIMPHLSAYGTDFWVELNIGVRHHVTERLSNPFTLTPQRNYPHTLTSVINYGKFIKQPYLRFKAEGWEALPEVAADIQRFMREEGFAFLASHQNVAALDHLLNEQPSQPSRFIHNQALRCFKGIVLAWLAQNPRFEELAGAYELRLAEEALAHVLLPNFRALVQKLRTDYLN